MCKKYILFSIVAIIIACQSTHYTSPESSHGRQIIIAEGGGFSGNSTQINILDNGQVFSKSIFPESAFKEEKTLDKKTVKMLFDKIDEIRINEISFSHPGNMSYSLALKDGNMSYEIKWGDPAYQVPASVLDYYKLVHEQLTSK